MTGPDQQLAGPVSASRTAALADQLARVRARIDAAARVAGRDSAELTLIAVTKTYPAADVLALARLGVPDIGENRDQEAAPKAAALAASGTSVRWHFVGRLQRNKCRSVAQYAQLVHSVDSVRLVSALDRAVQQQRDEPLSVLVQVSLDDDASRGGATTAELPRVAEAVARSRGLRLRGVMAVAPMSWQPAVAFARLAALASALRAEYPQATVVSAGMSGDLEEAVRHGATHLRIGSALLGKRDSLR